MCTWTASTDSTTWFLVPLGHKEEEGTLSGLYKRERLYPTVVYGLLLVCILPPPAGDVVTGTDVVPTVDTFSVGIIPPVWIGPDFIHEVDELEFC